MLKKMEKIRARVIMRNPHTMRFAEISRFRFVLANKSAKVWSDRAAIQNDVGRFESYCRKIPIPLYANRCNVSMIATKPNAIPRVRKKGISLYLREFQPIIEMPNEMTIPKSSTILW